MAHPKLRLVHRQDTKPSICETVSNCWAVLLSLQPQISPIYLHLDKHYVSYKEKDSSKSSKSSTFSVKRKISPSGLWEVVITNKCKFPIYINLHRMDEHQKQSVLDGTNIAINYPSNLCYILRTCDDRNRLGDELGDHDLFEKIFSLEQPRSESTSSFNYSIHFKTDSNDSLTLKILDRSKVKENGLNYLQEVALLHQFDHHSLDRIIEFKSTSQTLYMVLEGGLNRESMVEHLQRVSRVEERELKPLFRQLLEALHYLHVKGQTAHNNVNFNTVQVDNNNKIKLTDFTYARKRGDGEIVISDRNRLPCLTPPEMSCHDDGRITLTEQTAADVWCVGKMICAALTRPLPITSLLSDDVIGCNSACVRVTSIPLPDQLNDVSVEVEVLMEDLLFKDPKLRCSADIALRSTWFTEPLVTKSRRMKK